VFTASIIHIVNACVFEQYDDNDRDDLSLVTNSCASGCDLAKK